MHIDASNRAVGGVLVQEGHFDSFKSWQFKEAEQKYSAHEKKMLAVNHCLQVWRVYMLGTKFIMKTDNVVNICFYPKNRYRQGKLDGGNFFKNIISSGDTSRAGTIKWWTLLPKKR